MPTEEIRKEREEKGEPLVFNSDLADWAKKTGIVKNLLREIGDNPDREGLRETPNRVVKSWKKLFGGYQESAEDVLQAVFTEGACHEMVVLRNCEFYSTCEHHILPFFGKAHIGYLPNGKVVGVSKLARLVEVFSRRLQIQEQLTTQIADSLVHYLEAIGVMVVLEAQHFCMTSRGVEKQHSEMVTSAVRGAFESNETRTEFLRLIGK